MRFVELASLVVVGCGPGLAQQKPRDPQEVGRDAFAAAEADPAKFEQLVRGSVTNGGLWFDDSPCATDFGKRGDVPEGKRVEFAHCLAKLGLKQSPRGDAYPDVVVLDDRAGFEIEARVVAEDDGPRLTWIGWASRRSDQDNAPTIAAPTLEQLRTAGDASGPIDPVVASTIELDPTPKSHAAFAWFKVCIDDTGAVTEAHPQMATSVAAQFAFQNAIKAWKFRPFTIADQPVPVCAMVQMTYPAGQGPDREVLPIPIAPSHSEHAVVLAPSAMEGHRIAGAKMISPDSDTKYAIHKAGGGRLIGSFHYCLDATGHVESVAPLRSTGLAAYDRQILAGIMRWQYAPFTAGGHGVPVCTNVTFIYTQY